MRPRDFAGLMLLGALWGGSFLFIRVAVPALGPFLLVELRVGLAVAALFLYALAAGSMPKIRGRWRSFLVLGFLNAALPFSLISAAEIHLTASLAAILNATTVMFSAMVAAVWMGDALTARKAIGIVLGIVGVSVLVGWDPLPLNGAVLLAVAAMLLASLSYALGATYAKRSFSAIPPLGMAIGQLGGATALFLPLAVVSLPERAPSTVVTLSMLGLAFPFDSGGLPDLLPTHRERRANKHAHRHATRAHLRAVVRRPATRGALRVWHAGWARDHPPRRSQSEMANLPISSPGRTP